MSGRPVLTAPDWMRNLERRLKALERRAVPTASDLVGDGIAQTAMQVSDWNHPSSLVNGFFFSAPGAVNGPDSARQWIGVTTVDNAGGGVQRVTYYQDPSGNLLPGWPSSIYVRAFQLVGQVPTFTTWQPENKTTQVAMTGGDLTINSTTKVDCPGLSITYQVASTDEQYLCSVDLDVEHTGVASNTLQVDLMVGGAQVTSRLYYANGVTGFRVPFSFTYMATGLASGSTIFKVRANLQAGTDAHVIHGNFSHFSVTTVT